MCIIIPCVRERRLSSAAGQYLTLEAFKSGVIGPFLISEQDIASACTVPVDHGTSKPTVGSASDDDDE